MKSLIVGLSMCAAGAAQAASVTIDTVTGAWTAGATTPSGQPAGLGTNHITWGVPTTAGPSGYLFTGNSPATPLGNNIFTLGTFTHMNNPILDPSLVSATLNVTINGHVGSGVFNTALQFFYTHNETVNTGGTCCDDIVTVTASPAQTFVVDGVTLTLFGYLALLNTTTPLANFLTKENADTSAWLLANFSVIQTPIPGAAWLFATGLAGLIVLARRRKQKEVI